MQTLFPSLNPHFKAAAVPLPAFIQADKIAASLRLYRYQPEHIAELLNALSDAMQNEHYKHDGKISDYLHDNGEVVGDIATDLLFIAAKEAA